MRLEEGVADVFEFAGTTVQQYSICTVLEVWSGAAPGTAQRGESAREPPLSRHRSRNPRASAVGRLL